VPAPKITVLQGQIRSGGCLPGEQHMTKKNSVIVGQGAVTCKQIVAVARRQARVKLSTQKTFRNRMQQSQAMLHRALKNGDAVYGVNTGFGKACGKRMQADAALQKIANPLPFHGCGTGEPIGIEETRAAMLCRMLCLATGYSGVSMGLLRQLEAFLNLGITPAVPCQGSVGASGDLTPMSYIAAGLAGERDVFYAGRRMSARQALKKTGLAPYVFEPKEPLAMVNGTSTMTGIAVMAVERSRTVLDAAVCAAALTVHAFRGKSHHFHPVISRAKPFAGQGAVARSLTRLLQAKGGTAHLEEDGPEALQDPYSVRCTPQIAGVLSDALAWISRWVETEANSSNDNPIFDPATGEPLMSGNFYGGHIAFAMDSLKAALASVADMADRQIMLLVNPQLSRGLPEDLVGVAGREHFFHHGFKAMSITASALAAEALKLTMPAASFSRSSESHNQDKVSMGTISARDTLRICELVERVAAIHLMTATQACELRSNYQKRTGLVRIIDRVRSIAPGTFEDRPMDNDINALSRAISENDLFSIIND
jgi:histidine ammonia-lyase